MARVKIIRGYIDFLESMEINLLKLKSIEELGRIIVIEMRNKQCTVDIILDKEELCKIIKELRKVIK
mgnify:CR=1 FL=1